MRKGILAKSHPGEGVCMGSNFFLDNFSLFLVFFWRLGTTPKVFDRIPPNAFRPQTNPLKQNLQPPFFSTPNHIPNFRPPTSSFFESNPTPLGPCLPEASRRCGGGAVLRPLCRRLDVGRAFPVPCFATPAPSR